MEYVEGAQRMVTAAKLTRGGLYVRFADDREGEIPFETLDLPDAPHHVSVPGPYVIEIHLVDGRLEEIPWDFARHFADPGYRKRSAAAADRGRRVFGERLRALRRKRRITQQQLAEKAGINRVTIARFEAGERLPRYQTLVALAKGLSLPVERLLSD